MPQPFCNFLPPDATSKQFVAAVKSGDVDQARQLLEANLELRQRIDQPWFDFDSPAVVSAKHNRRMVETLLKFGANINARSQWWAGSFGILDGCDADEYQYYVSKGAVPNLYNAAEQGDLQLIGQILDADPEQINQPFGDGQCALHVAANVETARELLEREADPDIRCLDHSATAAQYQINNQDVLQLLIESGATPDIYMGCRWADRALIETILQGEPEAFSNRLNECPHTQPIDPRSHLHIYVWQLRCESPLQVLQQFGHDHLYTEYLECCPANEQLVAACWQPDQITANRIIQENPNVMQTLTAWDKKQMARAAWENRFAAVQLMLEVGFDPHTKGADESTPLDRAAFHGFHKLVQLLLKQDANAPLEETNAFGGTPLGACIHGSQHSWHRNSNDSDHLKTAQLLIQAGAKSKSDWLPIKQPELHKLIENSL